MHCTINSDFSEVRKVSELLHIFCTTIQLNNEIAGQLELILVEAVNNVIEHAYKKTSGYIDVYLEALITKVAITIKDKGIPVPSEVQNTPKEMPDINTLPEGGWGLGLIYALADDIQHYTKNNINIMRLTKNI